MKIAILDDYAGPWRHSWRTGPGWAKFKACFRDTVKDEDALVARLEPFGILCVMRERTPLPARVIARLPNLRLIVTTGPRNLSIDLEAAGGARHHRLRYVLAQDHHIRTRHRHDCSPCRAG